MGIFIFSVRNGLSCTKIPNKSNQNSFQLLVFALDRAVFGAKIKVHRRSISPLVGLSAKI